ncbi:MAG: DUF4118 domain-containing protein [Pyrinomonadaceae bacterium]|nr:DUF4118 domain-containing protein [Pyrinomonadaceae bacterium]
MSYALSMLGMAAMVALLLALRGRLNQSTIALALLLIILFTATWRGSRPALVNAVFGAVCFNFFFLPPYGTLTIADPQNWAALSAFAITAVTAGWLSAYAKRRAEEAESRQAEIERLYEELQASFQLASRAEALRQSERLKSALLDAVTHDIRTPLTSIKASVTTLLDEQEGSTYEGLPLTLDAETRREMLEVINEESDRLNRFVEGLIELARIEAGEMQLRRHWSSVEEIITTALARAAPLTRQHQIHIDSEKDLPVIRVDSRAVSEVIYTLIDNAAKYAPGGTLIRISAQRADDVTLLFAVEDEGPGIPPPLRERVFDKFFRAISDGDTGGQRPAGTGMGLAIAKGIVEAHDGRIRVADATQGRGARFEFTLPIGDDEEIVTTQTTLPVVPRAEQVN